MTASNQFAVALVDDGVAPNNGEWRAVLKKRKFTTSLFGQIRYLEFLLFFWTIGKLINIDVIVPDGPRHLKQNTQS